MRKLCTILNGIPSKVFWLGIIVGILTFFVIATTSLVWYVTTSADSTVYAENPNTTDITVEAKIDDTGV